MIDRFTGPARSPRDISYAFKWKNTSGEIIPAYACIKLDSYDEAGGFYNAVKPDGDGELHFANGPIPIAVDAYGGSQLWNQSRIGLTTSTTFGAEVGPVADSWNFEEGGTGFVVFSTPSGGEAAILQIGGGGAGSHRIEFTIVSVTCNADDSMTLEVTVDWYSGGCTASIPGADSYDGVTVEDPCGILSHYTLEFLEAGATGSAEYMYPRSGYCTPEWHVVSICGAPECA